MNYLKKDYFPSNPIFIDWAITSQCYLSCTHCRYQGLRSFNKELATNETIELATEIDAISPNWVLIEGGEPFLRKDIFKIIEILRSDKRPIYIISSGNGFEPPYAETCQKLDVKILLSLDSAKKATYEKIRQGASYEKVMRAIEICLSYKILDSINFTLQEINTTPEEIMAIGRLANELNINSINFLGFKPNILQQVSPIPNLSSVFAEIVEIKEKYSIKVTVDEPFFNPWLKKYQCLMSNNQDKNNGPIVVEEKSGCIFGEYVFIEPDGTIKPCSFSAMSYQELDKDLLRKIQDKRNRKGKCAKCEYQLECGGCRTRTYALTKNWFESDPFCPL
ncbi:MAG: radical SAM protein [candidate division WOR-3 bacterium]|nr:radical SAM protein [candidate division WOR-3 bacterium]